MEHKMPQKLFANSKLIIAKGVVIFTGRVFDNIPHQHHAIQITIGMEREFELQLENDCIHTRVALISSDIKHRLLGENGQQILLLIEPESRYGTAIYNMLKLKDKNYLNYEKIYSKVFIEKLKYYFKSDDIDIKAIIGFIFTHLDISMSTKPHMDERIIEVIDIIGKKDYKELSIRHLSNSIFLSESRLQHLFKEQIGISIKRFLLWKKMMNGIGYVLENKSFTFSAHEAGFSDSSHISRTFKEMFGITLSDLFKNSRSIQVFID